MRCWRRTVEGERPAHYLAPDDPLFKLAERYDIPLDEIVLGRTA